MPSGAGEGVRSRTMRSVSNPTKPSSSSRATHFIQSRDSGSQSTGRLDMFTFGSTTNSNGRNAGSFPDYLQNYQKTHNGPFLGVAPTNRIIHFETVDVMRVHNYRALGGANHFSLMQQLGGLARITRTDWQHTDFKAKEDIQLSLGTSTGNTICSKLQSSSEARGPDAMARP